MRENNIDENKYYTKDCYENNGKFLIYPLNSNGLEFYLGKNSFNHSFLKKCANQQLYNEAMKEILSLQNKNNINNDNNIENKDIKKNNNELNNDKNINKNLKKKNVKKINVQYFQSNKTVERPNPQEILKRMNTTNKKSNIHINNNDKIKKINNNNNVKKNKNLIVEQQKLMSIINPIIVTNNKEKLKLKNCPFVQQYND